MTNYEKAICYSLKESNSQEKKKDCCKSNWHRRYESMSPCIVKSNEENAMRKENKSIFSQKY